MLRRLTLAVIPLVLVAGALAACAEPTRIPPAEPPGASEPLFATDEEALAAATAAYEEYLAVSNAILQNSGSDSQRLSGFVSDEVLAAEDAGYALFRENGWRAIGDIQLLDVTIQQVIPNPDHSVDVLAYVCTSVAGTDVVDSSGVSQIQEPRETELAHEVTIRFLEVDDFSIETKTQWDVASICI